MGVSDLSGTAAVLSAIEEFDDWAKNNFWHPSHAAV
jgi:hypothetical protein